MSLDAIGGGGSEKKTAKIFVADDGTIHLDLNGFHGKGCEAIKKLWESIFGDAQETIKKPEYEEETEQSTATHLKI